MTTEHPGGYDAAEITCPVHRTPVLYRPAERFDPLAEVGCQTRGCTAPKDYDDAISQLLFTGKATLPNGITLDFTRGTP